MIPIADIKTLRSAGYSMKMPFRFILDSNGRKIELVCTHVTRILPGKRLVCFGDLEGQPVVAKFFLDQRGAKRHYGRELRGVKAFQKANINSPEVVIQGRHGPEQLPVLCFRRIMPAEDLFEAWEKLETDEQRIRLLRNAVSVVASQHEAGLKQNDLHRENFLLSGKNIFAIDGDAVDTRNMGKLLSKRKSLQNLGLFFTHLYPARKHLIPDIFKIYAEKRGWHLTDGLNKQLLEKIRKSKEKRRKEYLKKIYRECTEFVCRTQWNRFMVCSRNRYSPEMIGLLNDPDSHMNSGQLLKAGNTATVAMTQIDGRDVVIKRYNIKTFLHGLQRFFRPSRAWVSWRNAHMLTYMNISTPAPIALVESRWGPFRKKAYFISDFAEGTPLNHLFDNKDTDPVNIEKLMESLYQFFQSLAAAMIGHGDTKASNFLVTKDDMKIVDLDAMREYRSRWLFRRAFKRDCGRFMKNWANLPEIGSQFLQILSKGKR